MLVHFAASRARCHGRRRGLAPPGLSRGQEVGKARLRWPTSVLESAEMRPRFGATDSARATSDAQTTTSPRRPLRWPSLVGFTAFFTAAVGAGVLVGRCSATAPESPARTTVVRPSPSVIVAVRQLARLEGAVFSIERIIDVREKQSRFFDLLKTEDALLLVAAGEVTAGVDLGELRPDDVLVDDERRQAIVRLPRAVILSRRIDNQRTYVHTRRTDAWAVRQEHLETRARQEAERTLEEAALGGGILAQAEESVARTVDTLLRSLGYERVEVRFRDAEPSMPERPSPAPRR